MPVEPTRTRRRRKPGSPSQPPLSNAEIADRLRGLAQLLSAQHENPFKIKAYRRAADTIAHLPESVGELVRTGADLTAYAGIGQGIASALREIVASGTLRKLDALRSEMPPEVAALTEHPRLDPKRVLQAYKKLNISTVAALEKKLASGEVGRVLGPRMEQHFRGALIATHEILLYDAHEIVAATQRFLLKDCGVTRAEPAGAYRRRVEVVGELTFVIETDDFERVIAKLKHYGGRAELIAANAQRATFKLSSGILLNVELAPAGKWGLALLAATGSEAHLAKLPQAKLTHLVKAGERLADEHAVYRKFALPYIEPELREGLDEVALAVRHELPVLVTADKIRGELHAHTTSSDGAHTIEQMVAAARERGYEYLGVTDHSQSLKIARGVSEEDLWKQIRAIDWVNAKLSGFRVLKSAEVDVRADGTLDYPDELLRELDYTVCSIHSRFGLGKAEQTERILRSMDSRYFTILGHATGRLLLRRPGYDLDLERIVAHAKARGCFFEINSNPDRLDLRAEHARLAREAGVKIAISTDAHSIHELEYITCGIEQARRAGLEKRDVLNCLTWSELRRAIRR
jgi:DNA polymerase (family X)